MTEHTQLPLAETHTCSCGDHDQELPELDARQIPHAIRHAAIMGAVDGLAPGAAFVLVAPHDPLPLIAQMRDRFGDGLDISYVQRGPEAWKLKLTRG